MVKPEGENLELKLPSIGTMNFFSRLSKGSWMQ